MSAPEQPSGPFTGKKSRAGLFEKIQRGVLFISTYAIVFFALIIFGIIIFRGAPVLMDKGWDFFSRKPETLEVASFDKGKGFLAPTEVLKTMRRYNDDLPVESEEAVSQPFKYKTFKIEEGSLIGDGYLAIIEQQNDGFRPGFAERHTDRQIGFPVAKEATITLGTATFEELKASTTTLPVAEARETQSTTETFTVSFTKGFYNIPVKTVKSLKSSNLIYILYGNLTEKGDDELESLMPLDIPETQSVLLSKAQYSDLQAAPGDFKAGEPTVNKTVTPKWAIDLQVRNYTVPFDMFKKILEENPSLQVKHQHNIDRGSIELQIDGNTQELLVSADEFQMIVEANPGLKLTDVNDKVIEEDFMRFDLTKAVEIQLPTTEMQAFKLANQDSNVIKILKEYTHSYSGGGVAGPLIGTALLVFFCMIIALAVGVASSVYLSEYSRKGKMINSIRLAMMNLAGVPSIVFGLFGLGLFVVLAPKFTNTPSLHDKFRLPIAPSLFEPELREQEREKIVMLEKTESSEEAASAKTLASRTGYSKYYDGWYYLSFEGWGSSIIAGAFTLAIMVLPVIITSCEESLRAVPQGFREASLALGASKWQSIRTAVLPYAMPGILTASVLGITRVAGETAPIMFTAAVAEKSGLPFEGLQSTGFDKFLEFISQNVQALPYHIYTVSGRIPQSEYTEPMQYGSVLVFMMVVMMFAGLSIWLRARMRKKLKW
ncbi:ABC transporter permease subunit [Verrucomicrobiaceae bacterium R5-34]|nr:ABC transporter permease subunit [Verrucomicrobiaceae bacterium R5-34]